MAQIDSGFAEAVSAVGAGALKELAGALGLVQGIVALAQQFLKGDVPQHNPRQVQNLVQLQGNQQDRPSLVPLADHLAVDILNGPDIQSAGRLYKDHQGALLLDFTGNNRFLLIAAAHGTHYGPAPLAAADIVLFNQTVRIIVKLLFIQDPAMGKRFPEIIFQSQVFRKGKVHHQAYVLPVLRNIGNPGKRPLPDAVLGNLLSVQEDLPAKSFGQPGHRVRNFHLPVPGHARNGENFARMDLERNVFHHFEMIPVFDSQVLHVQNNRAELCFLFLGLEIHFPAYHEVGHFFGAGRRHVQYVDQFPPVEDGAAVRYLLDLFQLVGN